MKYPILMTVKTEVKTEALLKKELATRKRTEKRTSDMEPLTISSHMRDKLNTPWASIELMKKAA